MKKAYKLGAIVAISIVVVAAIVFVGIKWHKKESQIEVSKSYMIHAALAQVHRWFLLYENDESDIENQIDILDENISVKSGLGESKGHEMYKERVLQIPIEWENAHIVNHVRSSIDDDGNISLVFGVDYTNLGMSEDISSSKLKYKTQLTPVFTFDGQILPRFTSIDISRKSEGEAKSFVSAYPENRALSLIHYWSAIIEDPNRKAEPLREILASEFSLNFSSGALRSFEDVAKWLAGPASAVKYSAHKILDFSIKETAANTYIADFKFDWRGQLPNGDKMVAKTHHTWAIVDDPKDRFAKIKTIDVEVVEPFVVVE